MRSVWELLEVRSSVPPRPARTANRPFFSAMLPHVSARDKRRRRIRVHRTQQARHSTVVVAAVKASVEEFSSIINQAQ